jgi:hypothetical protein
MAMRWTLAALLTIVLVPASALAADWQAIITPDDRDRLDHLAEAINEGDAQSAASNPAPEDVRTLRGVLDPPDAPIATDRLAGDWRCRTIKVGDILVVYGWFGCRIIADADGLRLAKISGSQRLAGYLYPDGPSRLILLGASTVNDEPPLPYSGLANEADLAELDADVVGVLTQPAPNRLRILFPFPRYESIYDVMELMR